MVVESVIALQASAVFKRHYESFYNLRNALSGLRFQLLNPGGYTLSISDRWEILTHKLLQDKPHHQCNRGALEDPLDENGDRVRWRNKPFSERIWNRRFSLEHIYIINRKSDKAELFRPLALKSKSIPAAPSTNVLEIDLNHPPNECDFLSRGRPPQPIIGVAQSLCTKVLLVLLVPVCECRLT